jgi:hypothetical protein
MSRWYRAYEGTVTDAKLAEAALIAGVSRSVSIAAWHCILESAAGKNNCGSFDATPRRVAVILCEPVDMIAALLAAFDELGLSENSTVSAWKKRQFQSDDSKERVRHHRAKAKGQHDVTACNGDVTPPKTETDTEKEELSPSGDCPPSGEPALRVEHVVEKWNEVAPRLGKPKVRDITPERRQLVKARIAQYSIDDFVAVFGAVEASRFLREWRGLSFGWIMKRGNFQKILEGNYDD